ncbi:hypothetical protein [Enterococcus sp. AZ101]|uniref:hypothetical protein n=1 Tax=Enterococcus sp. AZ101 TaxID=2774742 RepID=UPI003D2B1813
MGFSLEVFIVGQVEENKYYKTNSFCAEKQYELTEEDILEAHEELKKSGKIIDDVSYPFYENINGKWYTLGKEEEGEVWWALGLIDTNFDNTLTIAAPWLTDVADCEAFSRVIVKEKYQIDLEKILDEMIESSPTKSLIIYPRYQSPDNEIVQGVIPFKKFIELLREEKIPFNVYSIIQK